jgi:UDP-N-acetylglucosamine 2-epimerase (non-hydrolysing)
VAVVLGTRPEAVKLATVVESLGDAAWIVHTGQHFDDGLAGGVLRALDFPTPDLHLDVGGTSRGAQIAATLAALEAAFSERPLRAVVVQGDTNAVLAGALAANAIGVPLFHVEAGLRAYDRAMPEEHNRVVTDHLADWCGAPTETSRDQLLAEGITDDRIEVTGNTVVDVVPRLLPDAEARCDLLRQHGLAANEFVLATIHRPENTDDAEVLEVVLSELGSLPVPVVLSLHPRTASRAASFGLGALLDRVRSVPPIEPRAFLGLAAEAALWVTDSGGLQEEASVLKRPVLVVRRSTERPEVQGTFAERVLPGAEIGSIARQWLDDLPAVHARLAALPTPYGDGHAGARTGDAVRRLVGEDGAG